MFSWIETPMREMIAEIVSRMPHVAFGVSNTIAVEFEDVFQILVDNALTKNGEVVSYEWNENTYEITNRTLQLLILALFKEPDDFNTADEDMETKLMLQNLLELQLGKEVENSLLPVLTVDTFNSIASLTKTEEEIKIVAGFETSSIFVSEAFDYKTIFGMPHIYITIKFYRSRDYVKLTSPPPGLPDIEPIPSPIHPSFPPVFRGYHRYQTSYQFCNMSERQKNQLNTIISFFNAGDLGALQIDDRINDLSGFLWLFENYSHLIEYLIQQN